MTRSIVFAAAVVLFTQTASADITFSFNYNDAAGTGFNANGAVGQQRRDALELAANNFSTAFSSYNANLVFDVDGTATGDTLAAAGSSGDSNFNAGFGVGEVIRNKILSGTDLNGSAADGSVTVNFASVAWQLEVNASVSSSQFDWYSTMYHEFAHSVGFASGIQTDSSGMNATDAFGTTGAQDGSWGAFDAFLTDSAGNSVFSGFDLNEATYESLLTGGASPGNGLFFNSADAGQLIGLYTPTTFEEGSSGSHLDDENSALAGFMMLAATGEGPSARQFNDLELSMFRDIGYANVAQISAVPEPSSAGLVALVLGITVLRRRRSS